MTFELKHYVRLANHSAQPQFDIIRWCHFGISLNRRDFPFYEFKGHPRRLPMFINKTFFHLVIVHNPAHDLFSIGDFCVMWGLWIVAIPRNGMLRQWFHCRYDSGWFLPSEIVCWWLLRQLCIDMGLITYIHVYLSLTWSENLPVPFNRFLQRILVWND